MQFSSETLEVSFLFCLFAVCFELPLYRRLASRSLRSHELVALLKQLLSVSEWEFLHSCAPPAFFHWQHPSRWVLTHPPSAHQRLWYISEWASDNTLYIASWISFLGSFPWFKIYMHIDKYLCNVTPVTPVCSSMVPRVPMAFVALRIPILWVLSAPSVVSGIPACLAFSLSVVFLTVSMWHLSEMLSPVFVHFMALPLFVVHSLLMATWILSSLWLLRLCEHRLCVDTCFIFSGVNSLE